MKRITVAAWHLMMRFMSIFDRIPEEDCVTFSPIQQYMLESDAEWQVAFLEYCWQLDPAKHYHD
jgi:hypothetical protein